MMSLLNNMPTVKHIHFVGIGGAGMSGIAEVLMTEGYQVSGSDLAENKMTQHLQNLGAKIVIGHASHHINGADMVVYSSMVAKDNPELVAAKAAHIPILARGKLLAELMQSQFGIAVAGTHGKTTTTGLTTSIFLEAGLDPTFVIGGLLRSTDTHARLGSSHYFIAEADESDASFLFLSPKIAIITNIDADHLNNYRNFDHLKQSFLEFIDRLPADGLAVLCSDDPIIQELLPQVKRPYITYGFNQTDQIHINDLHQQGVFCNLDISYGNEAPFKVKLNLPGRHNALNALAAIAVAKHCEIDNATISRALEKYQGTGRRFQIYGELPLPNGHALIVDDYGHHPREIAATLQAAKLAWPQRRVVLAFQPHRYSRTQDVFNDFVKVLAQADQLILLDIYPAGEAPIPGVTGQKLFEAIRQYSKKDPIFIDSPSALSSQLTQLLQPNDVLLLQGAGDIGKVAPSLSLIK